MNVKKRRPFLDFFWLNTEYFDKQRGYRCERNYSYSPAYQGAAPSYKSGFRVREFSAESISGKALPLRQRHRFRQALFRRLAAGEFLSSAAVGHRQLPAFRAVIPGFAAPAGRRLAGADFPGNSRRQCREFRLAPSGAADVKRTERRIRQKFGLGRSHITAVQTPRRTGLSAQTDNHSPHSRPI